MTGGYAAIRALARFLIAVFYREVEVVGLERVPAGGPLLVVANHPNGLVDPMLLVASIPRRLTPLAKAPLFRHPLIAPFLRLAGAIPVHRQQDEGTGPSSNVGMFARAGAALRAGRALMIFPEGLSQPDPVLMPLKTGAARLALAAARDAASPPVRILPVGLVGREPGTFRAGWSLVMIGEPFGLDDLTLLHENAPRHAVAALTDRIAGALRALVLEADDRDALRLARIAESIGRDAESDALRPHDSVAWTREALRRARALAVENPAEIRGLRDDLEAFATTCDRLGLTGAEPARDYPLATVVRFALREGASLGIGLLPALAGVVLHALPYQAHRAAIALLRPEPGMEATYKLASAVVLFPVAWIFEAWLAWRILGPAGLAVVLALLVPTGFFALNWGERLARVRRLGRAYVTFLRHPDLRDHLRSARESLRSRIADLARRDASSSAKEPAS